MDLKEDGCWTSSEQILEFEEDHEVGTSVCILDRKKGSTLNSWSSSEAASDRLASSCSYFRQPCCPQRALRRKSVPAFLDPFIKNLPNLDNRTGSFLHRRGIFDWIQTILNKASQYHTIVLDTFSHFIILSDSYTITVDTFSDIYCSRNLTTLMKYNGSSGSKNEMSIRKHSNAQQYFCLISSCEDVDRNNIMAYNPESHQKSLRNEEHPQRPCRGNKAEKMKKSVSFEEDVVVHLFDQEAPTMKLHSEACTSLPFNWSFNLPDAASEDNGLQWEDDFAALECSATSATNGWTTQPRAEGRSLSQMSLFLTYFTESDLNL
ncbi:PREDICTED: class A basic helix-loop-helix protein 15 isoform X1 [Cyprinodon variegatus]|uniref:class A basic helix-loop-helix protein 15 isoform X1 n=1 Tax=Cyprinodon variegatus TaxID=28743 RepID=UPI00074297D2|nr:PREDICTED: class A basic helix-loop-helix protein 15 isoform X1 [Cyprinodon variegatus]